MCVKSFLWAFFLRGVCAVICVWVGLNSLVFHSPIPLAAFVIFLCFFLSCWFSHVEICSFPNLQEWHLPLLHHTYQMRDVTGADEEKEEDESPIYHVSILSRWIIEKLVRLTRVARSCVCWLFFGGMSLCSPCCTIYLLHCLLGISLSICLSVCLLALARFSLLPPLKQSFLGCSDSHVIPACCARQAPAPRQRSPQPRYSLAWIQDSCKSDKPVMHINIHWHVHKHAWWWLLHFCRRRTQTLRPVFGGGGKPSLIVCVFNNLFCLHGSEVLGLVSELAGFNLFPNFMRQSMYFWAPVSLCK